MSDPLVARASPAVVVVYRNIGRYSAQCSKSESFFAERYTPNGKVGTIARQRGHMTAVSLQPDYFTGTTRFMPITVGQYHRMIATGIIEEGAPVELLDGFLVLKDRSHPGEDPMSVGKDHRWAVQNLTKVLAGVGAYGCDLQTQQPVTLSTDSEPEPDGAIITQAPDEYRSRNPNEADVHCMIEVADSSLQHDRTTKQRLYAAAGIPQYIIINLVDRVVELYAQPDAEARRYPEPATLRRDQTVDFACGQGRALRVLVEALLP